MSLNYFVFLLLICHLLQMSQLGTQRVEGELFALSCGTASCTTPAHAWVCRGCAV